jgi:tRNA nucleotidyltransferase (CCA-adding enzyme)
MHLVITHEQADFDALAASLAVSLLDSQAVPVLPRRLNRNLRAYLTLYGDRLPFIEFDELPRQPIEHLTLVDTQSMISLKGVGPETRVSIVDHHPPAEGLPEAWQVSVDEVGATTTLLVEMLQEQPPVLEPLTATFLLLGIYEDTGSLTYGGTTARDVRAAAWLMEHGANLEIAAEFLNHPLSNGQRLLYDRLLENAETLTFHGASVVIACASAEGLDDEISTIAHKLRDLFDPDGLFVLVALDSHVQLVARSTSGAIDVARVAEHFGGGGHDRAAAALIRDKVISSVRAELLSLLPAVVAPALTVGEIMSRGPHLLGPQVTVAQAARAMQRFGHEGYPVVEGGKVIGLLTRRAVDRAMAHGMGSRPVASVMDAGNVVVRPGDSIQHLQRMMILHDWGQVPVVDPQDGSIIGIVTRTDLIKSLGLAQPRITRSAWIDKLEQALPAVRLALLKRIATAAEERGDAVYIVGGFVRDLLLDQPSTDFDVVVEGEAIGLAQKLAADLGGRVSSHRRFGTAKWILEPQAPPLVELWPAVDESEADLPASLDFVTARTEFYTHPTALPSVERGSIKLDLHRRDFTINTMALRLDGRHYGQLLDPWGGERDLRDGKIRVLHSLSFIDDPTRMLRAVRLEQRLGFSIEARTLQLLKEARPLLERVSGERIRSELALIFSEPSCLAALGRLMELGLLAAIAPDLTWDDWLASRFDCASAFQAPHQWNLAHPPDREGLFYALWLFRLAPGRAQAVCERLHMAAGPRALILQANRLGSLMQSLPGGLPPSAVVERLESASESALAAAWIALQDDPEARKLIASYLTLWRAVQPTVDGDDLRRLGLPPGPAYRRVLSQLRAAWLDGDIADQEQERCRLKTLLAEEAHDRST